jgi:hypothetical protein
MLVVSIDEYWDARSQRLVLEHDRQGETCP